MTRLLLTLLLSSSTAHADGPQRFFPDDLQQAGRVSLAPGFSPDGNTLYFAQSEGSPIWKYPQRLKVSTRTYHGWSTPVLVPLPVSPLDYSPPRTDNPSVSPDGKTLLFSWSGARPEYAGRDITENFDLFTLDLTDPDAIPQPIRGANINAVREGAVKRLRYVNNENSPHLTRDGDLYFWTERLENRGPDTGERDIYIAPSDNKGGFLAARPLSAPINSAGRDAGSFVTPDGRLMLMSYPDRGGEGGDDIFVSTKSDGLWSDPVPLGPEVNSPYADFGARLTPDRQTLVFVSTRPFEGTPEGLLQIWSVPLADIPILMDALR